MLVSRQESLLYCRRHVYRDLSLYLISCQKTRGISPVSDTEWSIDQNHSILIRSDALGVRWFFIDTTLAPLDVNVQRCISYMQRVNITSLVADLLTSMIEANGNSVERSWNNDHVASSILLLLLKKLIFIFYSCFYFFTSLIFRSLSFLFLR